MNRDCSSDYRGRPHHDPVVLAMVEKLEAAGIDAWPFVWRFEHLVADWRDLAQVMAYREVSDNTRKEVQLALIYALPEVFGG